MSVRAVILAVFLLFLGLALEHLALPDLFSWLQIPWLLLLITVLVLHAPERFGLWMAIPFGLLLDAEHFQLFGLNTLTLAVHITLVQILYRRLTLSGWTLSMVVVPALVGVHQLLANLALWLVDSSVQVAFWSPVLSSLLLWPWLNFGFQQALTRLNLR